METKSEKIGFDLGGTIFQRVDGRLFLDHGALRVIRRLVTERFGERSYIIPKVDEEQKKRAIAALKMEGLLEFLSAASKASTIVSVIGSNEVNQPWDSGASRCCPFL
jgi:hypothetical protein